MAAVVLRLVLSSCLLWLVHVSADQVTRPKLYSVNLDLPPEQRWVHVVKDFKTIVNDINKVVGTWVPSFVFPLVEKIASSLNRYLPQPYAGEIKGIANALNTSVGTILMPNILYEVVAFCTSIVAQNKEGQIWHGRNLDFHFTDMLRNLTADINFQKGGKTLYTATTFVGSVGILTGQKPFGFTITIDERKKGALWMNVLTAILERNSTFVAFEVREALEKASDFSGAIEMLTNGVSIAPVYLIIGGIKPGEGAVITRDRLKPRDVWYLNSTANRWFLVETNYDHWVAPGDNRRAAAVKYMNAIGSKAVNDRGMFKVLSMPPLLRPITTYTSVMSAQQPEKYRSWIRHVNSDNHKLRHQHRYAFKKTNRYPILRSNRT